MADLTHEAIAQLRADVADLRFALGCEREALGKAIADYINLQAEVTAIRAENDRLRAVIETHFGCAPDADRIVELESENDRLRQQVEADAAVRQAAVDALAEAGCSGAGLQEHVGDAILRLRASSGVVLLRELRADMERIKAAAIARRVGAAHGPGDGPRWDWSTARWLAEHVLELLVRAAKEATASETFDVPDPKDSVDYDVVREIAETEDWALDAMEYLEPYEARDLCRELLRVNEELRLERAAKEAGRG